MFWLIQVAIVREYPQRSCFVENIYIYIYITLSKVKVKMSIPEKLQYLYIKYMM